MGKLRKFDLTSVPFHQRCQPVQHLRGAPQQNRYNGTFGRAVQNGVHPVATQARISFRQTEKANIHKPPEQDPEQNPSKTIRKIISKSKKQLLQKVPNNFMIYMFMTMSKNKKKIKISSAFILILNELIKSLL